MVANIADLDLSPITCILERIDEWACVAALLADSRFGISSPVHPATFFGP